MKTSRHLRQFASIVSLLVFTPHSSGETKVAKPRTGETPAAGKTVSRSSGLPKAVAPEPGAARLELKSTKSRYFLGEPFRVELVLTNVGQKPFSVATGGDYRGSNQELRYRVQAENEKGVVVPESNSPVFFGGGMMGAPAVVNPGKTWSHELWPLDYLHLTAPGKYRLRITHDFGWNPGRNGPDFAQAGKSTDVFSDTNWKSPIGEMTVEFVLPDENQVEAVLAAIAEAIKNKAEDRIPQSRDLTHPVYLAPLRKRVEAGETVFLSSIGEIPTREATSALVELAEGGDTTLAGKTLAILTWRAPVIARDTKTVQNEGLWDKTLETRARAAAHRLIDLAEKLPSANEESRVKSVDIGARLLAKIGNPEDYEGLRAAFDKALSQWRPARQGGDADNILDLPAPIPGLVLAMDNLHQQGKCFEEKPAAWHSPNENGGSMWRGPAETFLYFHWMTPDNSPRPKSFGYRLDHWAKENVATWQAAVDALPKPLPPEYRPFLLNSLNSNDKGVVLRACNFAGQSKDKNLIRELLLIIRAENDKWVLRSASWAVKTLEARRELAEALSDRLLDSQVGEEALGLLCDITVDHSSRGGTGGLRRRELENIQTAWKKWIQIHARDLEKGVRFKPGDEKNLPKTLFGRAVQWDLGEGNIWPMSYEESAKQPEF